MTSNQFGDKMGEGWKAGLLRLDLIFEMRLDWKLFYRSSDMIGDIDCAVSFMDKKSVVSIFPVMAKFPQSERINPSSSHHFFVEFKRSCDENSMSKHLDQFVSFYGKLLDPAKRGDINLKSFPQFLKQVLNSLDLILLFVYNGADNIFVERTLRNKLNGELKIHGRKVVTAWCPSEELIKWRDMQEMARLEHETERLEQETERLEQENEQLRRELDEFRRQRKRPRSGF